MTDTTSFGLDAPYDPFADATSEDQVITKGIVHIRLQQRNGRKCITTIAGLNENLDLHKLTKAFKKNLCCNGCVIKSKGEGDVIQLQGDQRSAVKEVLSKERIAKAEKIKVHGV